MHRIHTRAGDALPIPPAGEVTAGETSGRHIVRESHFGDVAPPDTLCPCAGQKLRLLLAEQRAAAPAQLGMKATDARDERAPDRQIHTQRDLATVLEDERVVTVVQDGERSPEVAAMLVEPRRWRAGPQRTDGPACVVDRLVLLESMAGTLEPIRLDDDVIVSESNDVAGSTCDTGIQRKRLSLTRFEDVGDRDGGRLREVRDDRVRV